MNKEAFVYRWSDRRDGKFYIGYHKGSQDDGYVCSSKSMLAEYHSRPYDFERSVIFYGSDAECRAHEIAILNSVNAASNPLYYNLNNGGYHIVFTDEVRKKMSISASKRKSYPCWLKGKKMPDEMKLKISNSLRGKPKSDQTRKRMSDAQSKIPRAGGFKQSDFQKKAASVALTATAQCVICGKIDRKGAITRYHNENCKQSASSQ